MQPPLPEPLQCISNYPTETPLTTKKPPPRSSSYLVAVGVPPQTPLFEVASQISRRPGPTTIPITSQAHSHALSSHPLVSLLTHSNNPNCQILPLVIPDPIPHTRLFVVSLIPLFPYTALTIRPPPQPPPPPEPPPHTTHSPGRSSPQRTFSRITDFLKSTSTSLHSRR